MSIDGALIHRARLVQFSRSGDRNAQGEYPMEAVVGPWFDARVMLNDLGGQKRQQTGQNGTAAGRVQVKYQVLADIVDENEDPLFIPASGELETECDVLGDPRLVIAGQPEFLNDGVESIGWLIPADRVEDVA